MRIYTYNVKAPIFQQALQKGYYKIDRDGRTRTLDTLDISQTLYQLSYVPLSTAGCMGRAAVFCVVTANQIPRQAVTPSGNIHIVESGSRKLYAFGFMLHYNTFIWDMWDI